MYDQISSMLSGSLSEDRIISLFEEWDKKPLRSDNLVAGVKAMREAMVPVVLPGNPIDTCGTGGSGLKTINTSTMVAFTVAAAGGRVAKHGNRSAGGNCGCFDVLEGLGIKIDLNPDQEQKIYRELGMVFLYARSHHPAMANVGPARKKFGKKTLFNLLGPLCNPAGVKRQMTGTGNKKDAGLMAEALEKLETERGLIVMGEDGLDEISVCAPSRVRSIGLPLDKLYIFNPEELGMNYRKPEEIEGGSVAENVEIVRALAAGKGTDAHRQLILVNVAHALFLTGLVNSFFDALVLAGETLGSGKVLELIEKYKEVSNDV